MGTIVTPTGDSVRATSPAGEMEWQRILREAVRDPDELVRLLQLPAHGARLPRTGEAARFPLLVPRGYLARMVPGDIHDPLLRQVWPLDDENQLVDGFGTDPVGDATATTEPRWIHKYEGRVLFVASGACAVHCRYCFRRHFPYADGPGLSEAWRAGLAQVADDPQISEVILSGGDPLMLSDRIVSRMIEEVAQISHVQRLRIHTRLPIVIGERVTPALVRTLKATRLTSLVVVHANHARELDHEIAGALARLVDAGIPVLNQAVLLRGVNDDFETLRQLSLRLVQIRVLPYYLHQLDRVRGAAHFEVPVAVGERLVAELRKCLPGYAVPRYVFERAGAPHKELLA